MYDTLNTMDGIGERGNLVTAFDQVEYDSLTDVGMRRSSNQDNKAVVPAGDDGVWRCQGHLFLVADGMGGHAVGEKASELAAGIIPHTYGQHAAEGTAIALRKAFLEANSTINAYGENNSEFRGTGTTSTALVLRPDGAWLGHVGDSRGYRVRNGVIEQLTYDHSYVWEYARLKGIDPSEVQDFPSNVIHRCLGPQPSVQVDVEGPHPIQPGDTFLLCSDGLSGQVEDQELGVIASLLSPTEACAYLIDLANLRGGPDNITVLVIRVKGGPEGVPATLTTKSRHLGPGLLSKVPWPMLALAGGVFLAGGAIALHATTGGPLAVLMFFLAVAPIIAGVAGLVALQRKKGFHPPDEDSTEPRIYRQKPCRLDRSWVEKRAQDVAAHRQKVEEFQVEADLAAYEEHHARAESLMKSGDLAEAFREYCRALRPLSAAIRKHRPKD